MNQPGPENDAALDCPLCGKKSLYKNERTLLYECSNPYCKYTCPQAPGTPSATVGPASPSEPAGPVTPAAPAWTQATYGEATPRRKHNKILGPIAAVLVVCILVGIFAASNIFKGETPRYLKASGTQMELVNKPGALNPSWYELSTFLSADETDKVTYVANEWDCVDYAERLHNNAEAAGIKAAFVALSFRGESIGHAANAFNTTDRGLVYVDCTGQEYFDQLLKNIPTFSSAQYKVKEYGRTANADKVAYAEIGKPYGLIGLETDYGPTYAGYDEWRRDRALFETKFDAYNALRAGRQFVSPAEYDELKRMEKEIDELGNKLGGFWEPLGIVNDIKIYW